MPVPCGELSGCETGCPSYKHKACGAVAKWEGPILKQTGLQNRSVSTHSPLPSVIWCKLNLGLVNCRLLLLLIGTENWLISSLILFHWFWKIENCFFCENKINYKTICLITLVWPFLQSLLLSWSHLFLLMSSHICLYSANIVWGLSLPLCFFVCIILVHHISNNILLSGIFFLLIWNPPYYVLLQYI